MRPFEFCPICGYKNIERVDAVDEETQEVIGSYWYCPDQNDNGCGWGELVEEIL